jgi:hypothetical protein
MKVLVYRFRFGLAATALTLAIVFVYLFLATSGTMTAIMPGWGYYNALADAFAHGQTYLLIEPDPRLLALPDPFDHVANAEFRMHDAILYNGKYYLYWGPVPALFMVPFKWLGADLIDDSYLVFVFCCGMLLFSTLLIRALWRRLFRQAAWWSALPLILVAGLGNAIPSLLIRPLIYEAAIAAGQCFLMAGLYWTFVGFAGRRLAPGWLLLGGVSLALALGSRISLVFAISFLSIMVLVQLGRQLRVSSARRVIWSALLFGVPPLLGVIGLGAYNHVRFGSWKEMGTRYQLYHASHEEYDPILVSWSYYVPNVYNYFLRPCGFQPTFPYLTFPDDPNTQAAYPSFISLPATFTYGETGMAGFLWSCPFLTAALIPFGLLLARPFQKPRVRAPKAMAPVGKLQPAFPIGWFALCLAGLTVISLGPPMLLCGCVPRYMADAGSTFVLLAIIGFWMARCALSERPVLRTITLVIANWLACYSAVFGVLLAFSNADSSMFSPEWIDDPGKSFARVLYPIGAFGVLYTLYAVAAEPFSPTYKKAGTHPRPQPVADLAVQYSHRLGGVQGTNSQKDKH